MPIVKLRLVVPVALYSVVTGVSSVNAAPGDLTFIDVLPSDIGSSITSFAIGDIDGDGDPDIVVGMAAGSRGAANRLWRNINHSGTMQLDPQLIGNSDTVDIELADFDGDGDLDLLEINTNGVFAEPNHLYFNDGSGQFSLGTQEFRLDSNDDAAVGDLNNSGNTDIVIITDDNTLDVWLNDGSANFSPSIVDTANRRTNPSSIRLADIDGDQDLDAIVGPFGSGDYLFTNDGQGNFSTTRDTLRGVVPWLSVGDVDGDLDNDLLIAQFQSSRATELRSNNGLGDLDVVSQLFYPNDTVTIAELTDLDGDGDLDLYFELEVFNLELRRSFGQGAIWVNDGAGVFTDTGRVVAGPERASYRSAKFVDLDNDSDVDGVFANSSGLSIFENNSNQVDTDGDGIFDDIDLDDDNDDQTDLDENQCGSDPVVASSLSADFDMDNSPDCVDQDDDNDNVIDTEDAFPFDSTESLDTDGDDIGNNADPDDDNDGVLDGDDAFPLDLAESVDTDLDTIGDNFDNCLAIANTDQADADEDGIGDVCEADTDADTIIDDIDNCPAIANTDQADEDNNGIGDACEVSTATGNIDAANPVSLNSWNTGFNATYEYTVQVSDTLGGSLREWKIDIVSTDPLMVTNAWVNSGYNAGVGLTGPANERVFTNEGKGYIDELTAGDVIRFTIQGIGTGFTADSLAINFESLSQILPATGECDSPIPVTLPFSFDGAGEQCWEVSGTVSHTNSWNTESVTINGETFTNRWSNSLPARVSGN